MSQAVSSSAGVNKSGVSEEEEVGVEDEKEKDESPMSLAAPSPSSLGTALASRSEGLSCLGTRRIDTRGRAAAAVLRVAGARSGRTAAAR